ncbi:MAG: histidine kinase dimerization/phosphoacceptor domain-containing protein, partial [Terriglobales bacterium]
MNSADLNKLEIGPGLKFTFALLIALILVGNGVLLWQFRLARLQTERLEDVSQELIGVLRLQVSLLSVHQRLDELAQSKDAGGIAAESEPLRRNLLEEAQGEMTALTRLPYETHVEPEFQPTLQAIEITLPTQLDAIDGLASSGDWKALRLRLDNELKPVESLCASLVGGTDQEVRAELALAVADMRRAQLRIFVVVQATAISTFFVAAVLGGAVTRRIIILRVNERVAERTRIARDLHDTMLQSFQGLMLHFQTGIDLLPERPVEARKTLEIAVDRADQAINEGRDAVQG